jgi:hypothetical protein
MPTVSLLQDGHRERNSARKTTGAAAVTMAHQRQPGEGSDPVG